MLSVINVMEQVWAVRGCRQDNDVKVLYVPESTGLNGMSKNCETSHT